MKKDELIEDSLLLSMDNRKFYVYCWMYKDTGKIFYVGKGTRKRFKELSKRSKKFTELVELYDTESKIMVDNLTEVEAFEIEKKTIDMLYNFRYPLINMTDNFSYNQRIGIEIAKQEGKYKGRKKIEFPAKWEEVYTAWKGRKLKGNEAMEKLGLKRNTFYNLVAEWEQEGK